MKYLLSKSIQLIVLIVIVGVLITLCLSNLVEGFKMVSIPANGLSNKYYAFSIGEYRDKITDGNIQLSDMLSFLKKQKSEIVLLKESDSQIFGVYAINHKFKPNIISGRSFSKKDFENKTNTIIISEALKDKCIEKNGKKFYQYDVNYFEVIGVFKSSNNSINKDARAYYNLDSNKLVSKDSTYDNYIFGRFQIDAGSKTSEIVEKLDDYCTVKVSRTTIDNKFYEKLQKTISSQKIALFPIVLIIFMILLNSINVSANWIENRKKEIFVRKLVGATNQKISLMLLKEFFIIVTLGYIVVLLLDIIISKLDLIIFLNFKFSIEMMLISYVVVMIIGLITAGLMLRTYYKNNISEIRR